MTTQNIKNIRCEIKKTDNWYEFTTFEAIRKCMVCKSEYTHLKRKYCLHCQKKNNLKIELYDDEKERVGRISHDLTKYSCVCKFSSWFGMAKSLILKNQICKHIIVAIRKIKNEKNKTDRTEENSIKV